MYAISQKNVRSYTISKQLVVFLSHSFHLPKFGVDRLFGVLGAS